MSSTIEERILEMRFNNTDFERKANQSIDTLDRLDKSMQLGSGDSGFGKLESALDAITNKFSILGTIGDQVIRRITDSVMDLANKTMSLVKSLSIDQVTAGWSKYGEKTSAVQTIMAATSKDWEGMEGQMEFVNDQLAKLNWFTDETSYSFLDMVNNIGKFTSNGVKLEDSVVAMQGISTWAALSGAGIQGASRAMYNLSQAMAVGSVKLIDWKSIENANMATRRFKETVLDTAVGLGQLTQQADGSYRTLQGHVFTIEQFNTQLSDGWFSSEVLMKTLDQFGSFSVRLQEVSEETGYTATELLLALEKYKDGKEVIPELASYLEELSAKEYELGLEAFKAAQEAKTFQEAIDATKDAVSTGWMNTFETIFGTYEEAKHLWTDLANGLYEVFAEGGNERNRLLKEWRAFPLEVRKAITQTGLEEWEGPLASDAVIKTIDGRDILISAFKDLGNTVVDVLDTIKNSFHDIFPKTTAEDLIKLTVRFKSFTSSIKPSEEELEKLHRILKGVFAIFDIGRMAVSDLADIFKSSLGPAVSGVSEWLIDGAASIGDWITGIRDSIKENDTFSKRLSFLSDVISEVIDWVKRAKDTFKEFFDSIKPSADTIEKLGRIFKGVFALFDLGRMVISAVANAFLDLAGVLFKDLFPSIKDVGGGLLDALANLADWVSNLRDSVKESDLFNQKLGGLAQILSTVIGWLFDAKDAVSEFIKTLLGLKEGESIWTKLGNGIQKVGEIARTAIGYVKDFFKEIFGGDFNASNIIKTLGGLLVAFFGFKKIQGISKKNPLEQLMDFLNGFKEGFFDNIKNGMEKISTAFAQFTNNTPADQMKKIAISIGILAAALFVISKIDANKIGQALLAVTTALGELIGAMALMGKVPKLAKDPSSMLIKMATAVLLLSLAIKVFSGIDMNALTKGLIAMTITLGVLVLALYLLSSYVTKTGAMVAAGAAMIEIAAAMLIMAAAIFLLGSIKTEKLEKGLAAMVIALYSVALALVFLSTFAKPGPILAAATAILLVSAAMVILAGAVAIFSLIPVESLTTGLEAMAITLAAVVLALMILSTVADPLSLMAAAAAMLIVSAAMAVMVAAIAGLMVLFLVDSEAAIIAMLSFAAMLAIMVVAIMVLGSAAPVALLGAAALLIVAAAMAVAAAAIVILSIGLKMLEGLPLAAMAGGLALIGAAMLVLGAGGLVAGLGVVGYAGLLVLGLGLNMLTGLDLVGMAGGLALLGAAFIPLGVGGLILTAGAAGMIIGAVGITAIGLAMIPLAAGLHALDGIDQESILKFLEVLAISVAALAGLGIVAEVFAAGFLVLGTACLEAGAGIALAGQGLQDIVAALSNIPSGVGKALLDMGDGIRKALKVTREDAVKELEAMMKDLVKAVSSNSKSVSAEGEKMSQALLEGTKKYNNEIVKAITDLINSCIQVIPSQAANFSGQMGMMMQLAYTRVITFVPMFSAASNSIASALSQGLSRVSVSGGIEYSLSSAVSALRSYYTNFYNAGYYILTGLSQGITDYTYLATNAVRRMAIRMNDTFTYYNQIRSPSKLYAKDAKYIPAGVAEGVDDNASVASDAIEDMGYGMITALTPALAILQGIINDQFDLNPSIRPTVDLSDIYSSSGAINGLFTDSTIGVTAQAAGISGRMAGIESQRYALEGRASTGNVSSPVINNYIYTQPGQDTAAIADEVERRMVRSLTQKRVAYVNR